MLPIYFQPVLVPCAPSCLRCPSTTASTSRLDLDWSESDSYCDGEVLEMDFERARGSLDGLDLDQEAEAWPAHPSLPDGDSKPLGTRSRCTVADVVPARSQNTVPSNAVGASGMSPFSCSNHARPHRRDRDWTEDSRPTALQLHRTSIGSSSKSRPDVAAEPIYECTSERCADWQGLPCQQLDPLSKPFGSGDPGYMTESSIRDWIATVETNAAPLPIPSALPPHPSRNQHVPHDISDSDGQNGRSREHITLALALQYESASHSTMPPEQSPQWTPEEWKLPQHTRNAGSLDLPTECVDDWRSLMGEALSSQVIYSASPQNDPRSILLEPTSESFFPQPAPFDTMLTGSPDQWADAEEWRDYNEIDGRTLSPMDFELEIVPPRPESRTPSDSDFNLHFHPMQPPPILDSEGFSRLMSRTFVTSAASPSQGAKEMDEDQMGEGRTDDAEPETQESTIACHFENFDFMDSWSPPALRSSSSASSQDPFHLEIFSPASEQPDGAAIWNAEEPHQPPLRPTSESPDYFSASSFLGWSSSSVETETKTEGSRAGAPATKTNQLFDFAITLHQPQPIRAIPPIDAELLLDEFPEIFG